MKKLIAGTAAALMLFSSAAALPRELSVFGDTALTASAASVTINSTNVTIYAVDGYYGSLTQPSSAPKSFQLKVTGAKKVTYTVTGNSSITVSKTGLIQPKAVKLYCYSDGTASTAPFIGETPEKTLDTYNFVGSTVEVNADGTIFKVNVNFKDYAEIYAEQQIDNYIAKNVKPGMTGREKLEQACKMAASYNYSGSFCSATGMIVSGGGDCWASTDLIIRFCKKCGISAWSRSANRDPGAGSGHMNVMAYADGKYYQADAGYIGSAPRYYSIMERASVYSYTGVDGGIEIEQYDGQTIPATLKIPASINGQKVVSIAAGFGCDSSRVEKIVIPEGVKSIGAYCFTELENLTAIELPASLTELGTGAFAYNNKLESITIASGNKSYCTAGGVIYNKNKTILVSCPAADKVTVPSTVKKIGPYAFCCNCNLRSLVIPEGVTELGENSFYQAESLEKLTLPSTLKTIGANAFMSCYSLYNLTVPQSVTAMGADCFGTDSDGNYERAIYGKKGSAAETYAKKNGIDFRTGKSIASCTISIPYYQYTYTGSPIEPKVTVKDGTKTLTRGKDYTVEYDPYVSHGVFSILIYGKGSYSGLAAKEYVVKPEKVKITGMSIINGSGIKVNYSAPERWPAYYEIMYSKDPEFKTFYKTIRYFDQSYVNLTSKPKTGETWYVKVRAVTSAGLNWNRKPYGNWSDVKSITVTNNLTDFTASIPYSSYTYTGKAITPEVTIKNGSAKLVKGTDYTVSYSNNTKVGIATIKITGKGNYKGTVTKTFVVKPAKNSIVSLTSTKAGAFTLKWTKGTAGTVGYEVVYSKDKSFKIGVNTWTTTNVSKTGENFSRVPKSGETWYVKVRSFYTKDGKSASTRYGNYSSVKTVKVK